MTLIYTGITEEAITDKVRTGTPILTQKSRGGAGATITAALNSLGLKDYIVEPNPHSWAERAKELAANTERLSMQRLETFNRMADGPLSDIDNFAARMVALLDDVFYEYRDRFS